jgi:ABC-2 type transport system permease protein
VGAYAAGVRLQLALVRSKPDDWMAFVLGPLMTVLLLAIVRSADRDDLVGAAVLAPALLCLVNLSLNVSGDALANDRWAGTIEPTIAAPATFAVSLAGRVSAVSALASLGFVQSWLVALGVFGVAVPVRHLTLFAAAVVATAFSMTATALLMASVFVLARSASVFQLSLYFPLVVLGGAFVPVALLPGWLQPVARLLFLSWSSDLLRDAVRADAPAHVPERLSVVVALGAVTFAIADLALRRVLDRVRAEGSATLS